MPIKPPHKDRRQQSVCVCFLLRDMSSSCHHSAVMLSSAHLQWNTAGGLKLLVINHIHKYTKLHTCGTWVACWAGLPSPSQENRCFTLPENDQFTLLLARKGSVNGFRSKDNLWFDFMILWLKGQETHPNMHDPLWKNDFSGRTGILPDLLKLEINEIEAVWQKEWGVQDQNEK